MSAPSGIAAAARWMPILLLAGPVAAQTLFSPSNATLQDSMVSPDILLGLMDEGGITLANQTQYNIAPLTRNAGIGQPASSLKVHFDSLTSSISEAQDLFTNLDIEQLLGIYGTLQIVDASSASNLTSSQIAYMSCDPNDSSNIDASRAIVMAGEAQPKAILLYSLYSTACDLTGNSSYGSIYTMISPKDSLNLLSTIQSYPTGVNGRSLTASINSNQTSTSSSGSSSDTSNNGGPAPTTAVAMSILYSITGIITLLFLIIIATGAVRAHRHPERYGPRGGVPGRPRQSRAKGLARAMLETLPIVKFGDPEPTKPENRDIELENGSIHHAPADVATVTDGAADNSKAPPATTAVATSGTTTESHTDSERTPEAGANEIDLGCSICTEDFTTGEDVRVLPCKHKYHPACIDPWLLNVSGTCPLCRHDLRPTTTNPENDGEIPPPLSDQGENGNEHTAGATETSEHPSRRRVSRFIDLHRLRHAPPDERIAALRRLREQSQQEGTEISNGSAEEGNRRASMTDRLRNKFRIRTRPEAAGSSEPSSGT
ncbi:hypothetical protein ACMFMG_002592 [Clarireedia jacksonii]